MSAPESGHDVFFEPYGEHGPEAWCICGWRKRHPRATVRVRAAAAHLAPTRMTAPSLGAGSAGDVEALADLVRRRSPASVALARIVARDILASDWLAAHVASASTADRERVARIEAVLDDEPLFVSGIRRAIERNTDGYGRGGDITHTPRPGRRGSGSCPGDNLTEWLDRIRAALVEPSP